MKISDAWFNNRSVQEMAQTGVAILPTLNVTGPNNGVPPSKDTNPKGEKAFIAGQSLIGGQEVIG